MRMIRQAGLPGFELGDYIRESIDFLRSHEPHEGYFVGFSGGKDSITALELCRLAGVRHQAFYSCTRIDPPEMYAFIKAHYPDVSWLFPKHSFWELIIRKSPPMRHMRWCCDELKKQPSRHIPLKFRVMGIRAEESVMRASRPRIDPSRYGQTLLKPIFNWPEWAVWEFIDARRLPYPSLNDEGFGRIGCVVCPFLFKNSENAKRRLALYQARWPGIWKSFEHAVRRWFEEKGSRHGLRQGQVCQTADEFWERYLGGDKIKKEPDACGIFAGVF